MNIVEKQEQVLEALALFPDWTERYEYVIGLGKKLPPLDDGWECATHWICLVGPLLAA